VGSEAPNVSDDSHSSERFDGIYPSDPDPLLHVFDCPVSSWNDDRRRVVSGSDTWFRSSRVARFEGDPRNCRLDGIYYRFSVDE